MKHIPIAKIRLLNVSDYCITYLIGETVKKQETKGLDANVVYWITGEKEDVSIQKKLPADNSKLIGIAVTDEQSRWKKYRSL